MIVKVNGQESTVRKHNGVTIDSNCTYSLGLAHSELELLVDALTYYNGYMQFRHGEKSTAKRMLEDLRVATTP